MTNERPQTVNFGRRFERHCSVCVFQFRAGEDVRAELQCLLVGRCLIDSAGFFGQQRGRRLQVFLSERSLRRDVGLGPAGFRP